jgi:hypothetical protein
MISGGRRLLGRPGRSGRRRATFLHANQNLHMEITVGETNLAEKKKLVICELAGTRKGLLIQAKRSTNGAGNKSDPRLLFQ